MPSLVNHDTLLHYSLLEGQARAVLIDSTRLCAAARRLHHLSPTATVALGRLLTGCAVMADMIKSERGSVTLTVKGDGPLGAMAAVGFPGGIVKGYCDRPATDAEDAAQAVGRNGSLTVVKDNGMRSPYVGQVPLVSGGIAEDLCAYMAQSEQIPSLLSLGVHMGDNGVSCAGGLLVQMLPGASEAALQSIEMSAGMFSGVVGEIERGGPEEAVNQLLSHLQPELLSQSEPILRCDCSRERVTRALISLGREELTSLRDEQHGATADCHFCNTKYRFTEDDLNDLLAHI